MEKSYDYFDADRISHTPDYVLGFKGDQISTIISRQSIVAVIEE